MSLSVVTSDGEEQPRAAGVSSPALCISSGSCMWCSSRSNAASQEEGLGTAREIQCRYFECYLRVVLKVFASWDGLPPTAVLTVVPLPSSLKDMFTWCLSQRNLCVLCSRHAPRTC